MSEPVTNRPVCVTGASGFIAAHVVRDLLEAGYRVRGTVRDSSRTDRYAYLTDLPGAAERLELVSADLNDAASFVPAVAGCEIVVHLASPYVIDVKDPKKDLVDPAVEGTRAVLAACKVDGKVRRVVVTSSMAAVTDEPDGRVLTEDDWNTRSSLDRNPYYFSKTLAEREAWRFVEEEKPAFDVVVVNPFLVVGPSLAPGLNTSNQIFVDMLGGKYPGIVDLTWGLVDVRDVAVAHRLAFEKPEAKGRYVCAAHTASMSELVALLRARGYGAHKLPKMDLSGAAGRFVVKMSSYFYPKGTGSYLRTHVGRIPRFDNGKIRRDLGIDFRPLEETVVDTVEDLFHWEHVARRAA